MFSVQTIFTELESDMELKIALACTRFQSRKNFNHSLHVLGMISIDN